MKWREWKEWIEAHGVKDDDEIAYIDCTEPEHCDLGDKSRWCIW